MPLTWLGQLSPTMQQQIALQRALLALQREDEQIRMKTMPQAEQPALARKLVEGPGPAIPGGPTYQAGLGGGPVGSAFDRPSPSAFDRPSPSAFDEPSPSAFKGRGLEGALRTGVPVTGRPDWQAEAWARRKEIGEEHIVGAKEAYDRIITLDPNGQKVALNALRRYKREVYNAMEKEGYLSPAGELVQPKQAATSVQYVTADNGEMIALTTYPDGRVETEHTGVYPAVEAEEAGGPTISEAIELEKLGMKQVEFGERYRADIIKVIGEFPRIGMDTVTEDGKDIPVEPRHVNAWLEGYALLNSLFSARAREAAPEGEVTMSEAQREFEASTGEVKAAIQQKLGVSQTMEWDEETEFAMSTYGDILLGEKPVEEGEKKPKFERQKAFWNDWLKTWGKVFKKRGSVNIAGQTREEWEARKAKKGVE